MALFAVTAAFAPAAANLPAPQDIAKMLAKALGAAPAGGVTILFKEVPAADPERPDAPLAPPTWRLRLRIDARTIIFERENLVLGTLDTQRFVRGAGPAAPADAKRRAPAWIRLLAGDDVSAVAKDAGIAAATSLARDRRTILWVWGAGPRDRKSPQIHIDRSDGRLHRVIADGDDMTLQGRFDPATSWGRRLPRTALLRRGKTVIRFDLHKVTPLAGPIQP